MKKIVAQCTVCHRGIDLSADTGKLALSFSSNGLKDLALAVREVMSDAKRRHIPARQKPNAHRSTNLQKFWLWMAGTQTQFNNFLRATSPTFNQSSAIEDLCDQWISRSRQMLKLQILNFHAKRKTAGTPNLQAVIVNGQTHCTACLRIVPMTERVDQCFPQSNRREEWLVYALKKPGFDSA
jgi:hypothetical protein